MSAEWLTKKSHKCILRLSLPQLTKNDQRPTDWPPPVHDRRGCQLFCTLSMGRGGGGGFINPDQRLREHVRSPESILGAHATMEPSSRTKSPRRSDKQPHMLTVSEGNGKTQPPKPKTPEASVAKSAGYHGRSRSASRRPERSMKHASSSNASLERSTLLESGRNRAMR